MRRRVMLARGGLIAAAAIPVALVAVALSAASPEAAWAAVPRTVDAQLMRESQVACSQTANPVVLDVRGSGAVAVFEGQGDATVCQFALHADGSTGMVVTSGTHLAGTDGARLAILTTWSDPKTDEPTMVIGTAGRGAAVVRIRLASGQDVVASVANGYYLAWWPAGDPISRVEAVDAGGSTISALDPAQ